MSRQKKITSKTYESKIQAPEKKEVLRTAAYCRVSTDFREQELSYDSQCAYYEAAIGASKNKVLVGIYGDQGISGLHADERPELQRLLDDCRAGKIDLVMTKSISRLARNAKECLEIVDELNALGIPIIFEKEGIQSDNIQVSLILKLLVSAAQEESNSISQAIKWSYDKNVQMGTPTRVCPYGYRKEKRTKLTDKHVWVVYEPEAKRVRRIFELLLENKSYKEIASELDLMEEEDGSDYRWKPDRVRALASNEAYKGDILSNKTFKPDYLSKRARSNKGEREQFYIEGHHDPIVTPDLFDEVQIILASRKQVGRPKKNARK